MPTPRKALIRLRVVHWRRKENADDANRRSFVFVWSIGGERRMLTTRKALLRLRVVHWRREEKPENDDNTNRMKQASSVFV